MTKSRLVKVAKEASLHAGIYAYAGRKQKKRDFRRLWIVRISEACKLQGISYSKFIFKLNENKIKLDRKVLSDMIVNDPATFKALIDKVAHA